MKNVFTLASRSPRRRELLSLIRPDFQVVSSDFEEGSVTEPTPQKLVERLSYEKARTVANAGHCPVLGADTVVVSPDGEIFGIPRDRADAARMLDALSGKRHQVITGVTLLDGDYEDRFSVSTDVYFREITPMESAEYLDQMDWRDKAGGYGIQGRASIFVQKIDGDYFNVVGLPVSAVYLAIKKWEKTKNL